MSIMETVVSHVVAAGLSPAQWQALIQMLLTVLPLLFPPKA